MERIDDDIAKVEGALRRLLERQDAVVLSERMQAMCLVCGIGEKTAWMLIAELP
jgi:hypothetical protein